MPTSDASASPARYAAAPTTSVSRPDSGPGVTGSMTRSQLSTTSWAVMGVPSLKVMSGRSVNVRRWPSSDTSHRSASAGRTCAAGSNAVSPSQTCATMAAERASPTRAGSQVSGDEPAMTRSTPSGRDAVVVSGAWGVTDTIASTPTPIMSATRTRGPTIAAIERRERGASGGWCRDRRVGWLGGDLDEGRILMHGGKSMARGHFSASRPPPALRAAPEARHTPTMVGTGDAPGWHPHDRRRRMADESVPSTTPADALEPEPAFEPEPTPSRRPHRPNRGPRCDSSVAPAVSSSGPTRPSRSCTGRATSLRRRM